MSLMGVVLAGGQARRFGSDKALAMLGDRPLIAHAAAVLAPHVAEVVVAGREDSPLGRAIADWPAPGLGPLGGICGALRLAAGEGHGGVLSTACDMPRVPPALLARLAALPGAAYVATAPVLGRWPVEALAELEARLLAGGERSIAGWARAIGAVPIAARGGLPNVNRPADLDSL